MAKQLRYERYKTYLLTAGIGICAYGLVQILPDVFRREISTKLPVKSAVLLLPDPVISVMSDHTMSIQEQIKIWGRDLTKKMTPKSIRHLSGYSVIVGCDQITLPQTPVYFRISGPSPLTKITSSNYHRLADTHSYDHILNSSL